MRVSLMMMAALLLGPLVLGGCLTTSTSDDPVANTIYDMHRKVSRLDKELGGTVEHLNETAADLGVRVNESNTQAREVQSMVEENQRKLEQVERKLDSLTRTLYEQFGITMPSGTPSTGWGSSPGQSYVVPGEVQVEPPKVGTPAASLTPEPDPLAHTDGTVAGTKTPVAAEASQLDPVSAYNKAMEAYQRDQFEEALKLFSDFTQRYPDSEISDNAQFWKGECLYNLGRYEECVAEFEKLRTDFPDSAKVPYGMFNQAAAHLKLGQQARAFALLEDLVENYPMTPAAARARSKLKEVQGN